MFKKNALKIFAALSVLLLVLVGIFALAPQVTAQAAPTPTRTNTACPSVYGYVYLGSTSGPGLPNVKVTGVSVTDDTVASGTTDSSGRFSFGCGRSGMIVTPVLSGYSFSPPMQTYPGTGGALIFVATATTGNQPDLTVVSITQFPYYDPTATPNAQGCRPNVSYYRFGLRVTIQNIGAVDAGAFVLDFNTIQTTVSGLAAGQALAVDFSGFTLPTTRTATVDITNLVAESNETNNVLTVTVPPITPTRTGTVSAPICLTATPTPTGGVSLTPTRTMTASSTPTWRSPTPWATPTRTNTPTTGPSLTPTRTPTFTPTAGFCAPTATIAAPFTYDGTGNFCWQSTNLGTYINTWNLSTLTINGIDYRNIYVPYASYPPKVNGYWYVNYISTVSYGHFEAK